MDSLQRRARQIRSRALVRSWDYRQRSLARGVWFRLRRLLADASAVYRISDFDADLLTAEGHQPEPVGQEVDPPKRIFFVAAPRVAGLPTAQSLPVRLDGGLLTASCLALVPFPQTGRRSAAGSAAVE